MAQLMPLPPTVSCFSKMQIGFTFLVPAHSGSPGKRAVKRVCVCEIKLPGGHICMSVSHTFCRAVLQLAVQCTMQFRMYVLYVI